MRELFGGVELMLEAGLVGCTEVEGPEISHRRDYYKGMMKRKDLQKLIRGIVNGSFRGIL